MNVTSEGFLLTSRFSGIRPGLFLRPVDLGLGKETSLFALYLPLLAMSLV